MRRDEAKARAAEQEAERETRDDAAAERLRLLRGGQSSIEDSAQPTRHEHNKRKRDEDDPVQLYRDERPSKHPRASEDARDRSRKRSEDLHQANVTEESIDQISNMRFRDAAGRHAHAQRPWYSTTALDHEIREVGRDVWGNEDAGRHARNQKRLDASDPLLAIKKGVKQLKDVEKQKAEWRREREKDLYEVEDLARRERHRRRKEERHTYRRDKHRSHRSSHDHQQDHNRDRTKRRRDEQT